MYYVVKTTIEDGQHTEAVTAYETKRQATIQFHDIIANTLVYDVVISAVFLLVDHDGAVIQIERYFREDESVVTEEEDV